MQIAFLGMGIMGRPMAANLVKAGHSVTVWNRTPGKTVQGARVASTPAEAANGADVVWICVSDTAAVEQVLFGSGGVHESLRDGMVVVDSSTISPSASVGFAERVRAKGGEFVDAPVTGSKTGAETAQLIFITGGNEQTIARLDPVFNAMGKLVVRVGENGKGLAAKLAMNLMIATIFQGFAEAWTLAGRLGVNKERLLSLINASMVRSGVVEYKAPFVMKHDFTPNFPLRLMHKDIHLMLEVAAEQKLGLPTLQVIERIYAQAQQQGRGDLDYAVTLLLLEEAAEKAQAPSR